MTKYRKERHLLPEFIYLIGTRAELLRVWKAYHVDAVARDPELVDHSAYTVLIDQEGEARVLYDSRVQAKDPRRARPAEVQLAAVRLWRYIDKRRYEEGGK